jgi:replicative DNA helicase
MGELFSSGERDIPVWSVDDSYRLVESNMTHVFASGEKEVFEMRLASGRSIKASANHPFLTFDGWRRLDQLATGVRLAVPRRAPEPTQAKRWAEAEVIPAASRTEIEPLHQDAPALLFDFGEMNVEVVFDAASTPRTEGAERHPGAESDLFWDEIVAIESLGVQPVFDATVPGTHNFIANGIVTHNSLEQDADVVLFVYREVVYKPDTAEPGKAQLIVAKQRNGPTDDVDMTFLREFTKFVPYSPVMSGETEPGF